MKEQISYAEKSAGEQNEQTKGRGIDLDYIAEALRNGEVRQKLIFENDEIVNEVIERYLTGLVQVKSVPVVRGLSALTPVAKPKTLSEAKAIVDGK